MVEYDFSGLWYHVKCDLFFVGLLILFEIVGLLLPHLNISLSKKVWEKIVIAILCTIQICSVYELTTYIRNPDVKVCEGVLARENRRHSYSMFTWDYKFEDADGNTTYALLDSFTRKKMLPEGFVEGEEYRVYYEDNTDIIVKIEKLE